MKRLLLSLVLSVVLVLPISLVSSSCAHVTTSTPSPPKTPLQVVSSSLNTLASGVVAINMAAIQANEQKLLTDMQTSAILNVTTKIAQAGLQADAITRALAQIDPNNKAKLLSILSPVLQVVTESLNNGLIPVGSQASVNAIRAALVTIQVTLTGVQIVLQGGAN